MFRVSSRQRIVSWDAFEATTDDEDDRMSPPILLSSTFEALNREHERWDSGSHDVVPLSLSPLSVGSRKRDRLRRKACLQQQLTNQAVSTFSKESHEIPSLNAPTALSVPSLSFDDDESNGFMEHLLDDVQLQICSFLDVDSVRCVMATNTRLRRLLQSSDAHFIWLDVCRQKWQGLADTTLENTTKMTRIKDQLALPTAAGTFEGHAANLPLLLSMTPTQIPTCVDKRLVTAFRNSRRWRSTASSTASQLRLVYDKECDENTNMPLVRFVGQVGTGDRCIRANAPFPRPVRRLEGGWSGLSRNELAALKHPSLLDLLCRGAKAVIGLSMSTWRPFVVPYIERDNSLQVAPRMVAYYEVSILDTENAAPDAADDSLVLPPGMPRSRRHVNDCVAVGLATQSFHLHSRMPGWDCLSFGYHGDDGGIFHASGGMVKRFGPSFGAGDTVGCGIDYVTQGIFFTLNGNFLGYGWTGIGFEFLQNDLYPVVGIDTNSPIRCNFGAHPFSFDLTNFHMKYQDLVRESYKWAPTAPTPEAKNHPTRRRQDLQAPLS